MMAPRSNVHQAAQMRVLAHPTRLRLLALLRELGPQTAAHLSEYVDEAPGTLSYHLAKLADADFIEEDPEAGSDGRQRWWRPRHEATVWDTAEFSRDPEKFAAQKGIFQVLGQHYAQRFDAYVESTAQLPEEWVRAGFTTDRRLRLTVEQMQELNTEIHALEDRWLTISAQNKEASGAEEVFFLAQGYRQP